MLVFGYSRIVSKEKGISKRRAVAWFQVAQKAIKRVVAKDLTVASARDRGTEVLPVPSVQGRLGRRHKGVCPRVGEGGGVALATIRRGDAEKSGIAGGRPKKW